MDRYWASVEKEKIGAEIMEKVEQYHQHLDRSGMLDTLRKAYVTYYGNPDIEQVDDSLQAMSINHFANLIRHIHVMVTGTRPAWEPRAINTDSESQANTQLASGLLDFYMREKQLDKVFSRAVELALFLLEGWISLDWNVSGGEVHGVNPETQEPIYEGDVKYDVHNIMHMIRDVFRKDMNHEWFIIETDENKWNLAAKYPEWAEKLGGLQINLKEVQQYSLSPMDYKDDMTSDLIPVYTLRHKKTEAMPQGRMTIVVDDEITLFDGPLPFKDLYVYSITSSQCAETAFGHSHAMDLLPIQNAFDSTVSAILSNQAASAVNNFQAPKGAAPRVTQIEGGGRMFEYDAKAGKIEVMELLRTAPEVFNFAEFLVGQAELISGVNQISRGNAPATLSGTAMALIQQQAIQFSSGVQQSLNSLCESVGTGTIQLLQTYAVVPRVAMIAGKSKRSYMKSFKGEDLKGISRVVVDSANPLTKTAAGRTEIANQLLQTPNMIKTPEQYIAVLTSGNLEPLYEHESSTLMLMRSENEWMMDGKPVQALMTDDHPLHIIEHSTVLNSPEVRQDPSIVQTVLAHIQEHIGMAKTMDPALAAMLKQASFAQPPMPMPGAPVGPPQGNGPAPVMDNQNPITQQAEATKLPQPAMPPEMQN